MAKMTVYNKREIKEIVEDATKKNADNIDILWLELKRLNDRIRILEALK